MLHTENSAVDLMLRGFPRPTILVQTDVDIGYNGRSFRDEVADVDRTAYKSAHIVERVGPVLIKQLIKAYSTGGLDKDALLAQLRLGSRNTVSLAELFAGAGYEAEWTAAAVQHQIAVKQQGMVAKHGVTNAFELPEVQAKASATKEANAGRQAEPFDELDARAEAEDRLTQRLQEEPELRALLRNSAENRDNPEVFWAKVGEYEMERMAAMEPEFRARREALFAMAEEFQSTDATGRSE